MGKAATTNIAAEQEFSKLELLLTQTADDAVNCLRVLKGNLADYDTRHGLHFVNTSKSFMRSDMRAAKDTATELRHVANQISKSKAPPESSITAARSHLNATADALNELKRTGRAYDEKNGKSKGIPAMIDNVLVGKHDKTKDGDKNNKHYKKESSWFGKSNNDKTDKQAGVGVLGAADTVEAVVKATLKDSFSGFSALKHQISTAEKALSPSFAERAKEAVAGMTNKLRSNSSGNSPPHKSKKTMSV